MEIKKFTFKGFIRIDWNEGFKTVKLIDGKREVDLVKKFRAIFDLFESEVSVSYFTSNEKKTESEILEKWLRKIYGEVTAEYETDVYCHSSHTYGTDYNTHLQVGGHDLIDELGGDNEGKWCVLKISVKVQADN